MHAHLTLILEPVGADRADDAGPQSAVHPLSLRRSPVGAGRTAEIPAVNRPPVDAAAEAPPNRDKLPREATPMELKGREFEETKWSLVLRAGAAAPGALQELCRAYRAPLQAFALRLERDPERAQDVVQGFLIHVVEQNMIGAADPARGSFRAFLRKALRNYAINVHRAERARKRGGEESFAEPDFEELASEDPAADRLYDQAWARALLDRALARLRDEQWARPDKRAVFEALCERLEGDDDGATLLEAAKKLGKTEGALKLSLFRLRRRYFDLVRAEVAATVPGPEDVDAELRNLRSALRGGG